MLVIPLSSRKMSNYVILSMTATIVKMRAAMEQKNVVFCWCCLVLLTWPTNVTFGSYQWFLVLQEKRLPIVMMRATMVKKNVEDLFPTDGDVY